MSPLVRSLLYSLVESFAVLLFVLYRTLGTPTGTLYDSHLSNPILSLESHSQSRVVFRNLFQLVFRNLFQHEQRIKERAVRFVGKQKWEDEEDDKSADYNKSEEADDGDQEDDVSSGDNESEEEDEYDQEWQVYHTISIRV